MLVKNIHIDPWLKLLSSIPVRGFGNSQHKGILPKLLSVNTQKSTQQNTQNLS